MTYVGRRRIIYSDPCFLSPLSTTPCLILSFSYPSFIFFFMFPPLVLSPLSFVSYPLFLISSPLCISSHSFILLPLSPFSIHCFVFPSLISSSPLPFISSIHSYLSHSPLCLSSPFITSCLLVSTVFRLL